MRLKIEHTTSYQFDAPIFLEPHHLYLVPSPRFHQDIHKYELIISPEPSGLSRRTDAENNGFFQCWFSEKTSNLAIKMNFEVEIRDFNAFDFLVESDSKIDHSLALKTYLYLPNELLSNELKLWAKEIHDKSGHNVLNFIITLCDEINNQWSHELMYHDDVLPPNECFEKKTGSCRDLSWMIICMLRNQNIPAKYVSGYAFNEEVEGHELHAWVDVWIPGSGWIPADPTAGSLISENYVPLTSSHTPTNTLPVTGSFRGKATSQLETSVKIFEI